MYDHLYEGIGRPYLTPRDRKRFAVGLKQLAAEEMQVIRNRLEWMLHTTPAERAAQMAQLRSEFLALVGGRR